jgi:hypothetical protein
MRCHCGNTFHNQGASICRVCGATLPAEALKSSARTSRHYKDLSQIKRHTFVRVGAPPIELQVDKEMRIGRSRDCDLVIQSPRVSRVHALLFWQAGDPYVRDLVSQNGVFVNGAQVREVGLKDGDELTIGPFTCTYRKLGAIHSVGDLKELLDEEEDTQEVVATAMAGRLAEVSLYEVCETLAYLTRTGTLEVFGPWGDVGRIGLRDGNLLWAELADITGRAAIEALLEWTEGHFRFTSTLEPKPENVGASLQTILEAARRRTTDHGLSPQDYGGAT